MNHDFRISHHDRLCFFFQINSYSISKQRVSMRCPRWEEKEKSRYHTNCVRGTRGKLVIRMITIVNMFLDHDFNG